MGSSSSAFRLLRTVRPIPTSKARSNRADNDSHQLVHISNCVFVPHAWHQCRSGSCQHSDWLLCIRYHLQVWCRNPHLPDHVCKVEQRGFVASVTFLRLTVFLFGTLRAL